MEGPMPPGLLLGRHNIYVKFSTDLVMKNLVQGKNTFNFEKKRKVVGLHLFIEKDTSYWCKFQFRGFLATIWNLYLSPKLNASKKQTVKVTNFDYPFSPPLIKCLTCEDCLWHCLSAKNDLIMNE